jgi:putative effector of murein hydrolase
MQQSAPLSCNNLRHCHAAVCAIVMQQSAPLLCSIVHRRIALPVACSVRELLPGVPDHTTFFAVLVSYMMYQAKHYACGWNGPFAWHAIQM